MADLNDYADRDLGAKAEILLGDDTLNRALNEIEATWTGRWKNSKYGDAEGRELAFHMVAAVTELKAQLQAYVADGKIAARVIESEMSGDIGHG